jgi:ribosomal protein L32
MGQPKKRTSPRRTRSRRSHLVLKLARQVNAKSPTKAYTTKRESAKTLVNKVIKTQTSSTPSAK